jgi:hypothetical protein
MIEFNKPEVPHSTKLDSKRAPSYQISNSTTSTPSIDKHVLSKQIATKVTTSTNGSCNSIGAKRNIMNSGTAAASATTNISSTTHATLKQPKSTINSSSAIQQSTPVNSTNMTKARKGSSISTAMTTSLTKSLASKKLKTDKVTSGQEAGKNMAANSLKAEESDLNSVFDTDTQTTCSSSGIKLKL